MRDSSPGWRASLTYSEVGATAGRLPAGYNTFRRTRTLDRTDFGSAAEELLAWEVHRRSGLRVTAGGPVVAGAEVQMRLGPVRIPCRVVYVVDEPDRQGFAYGTLPGHPETGEEAFLLERRSDGRIDFTVTAFSNPATRLARLGGPVSQGMQHWMTTRYLKALDQR